MSSLTALQNRRRYATILKNIGVNDYNITGLSEFFQNRDETKPVAAYLNHGSILSWSVVLPCLIEYTLEYLPDYTFGSNYHKILRSTPILNKVAAALGGLEKNLESVDKTVEFLKENPKTVIGTMPEGSNCTFDYNSEISPFSQFGLIKAAILANADMLLVVHKGTEHWDKTVIPFPIKIKGRSGFKAPTSYRTCDINIIADKHECNVKSEDFVKMEKDEQRNVLGEVAKNMRTHMIDMHSKL